MAQGLRLFAAAVSCLAVASACSSHAAPTAQGTAPPQRPTQTTAATEPTASFGLCQQRDLMARFAGGGLGTGNDFGSIVIWNTGSTGCRVTGRVTFSAYFRDGRRDSNARPNRRLRPVNAMLPAKMAAYRNGAARTNYLVADLMGPERDDPSQPDALCRDQDKLSPAILVLHLGRLTFRVTNFDPRSRQVKHVYGCHGRVLLERVGVAS